MVLIVSPRLVIDLYADCVSDCEAARVAAINAAAQAKELAYSVCNANYTIAVNACNATHQAGVQACNNAFTAEVFVQAQAGARFCWNIMPDGSWQYDSSKQEIYQGRYTVGGTLCAFGFCGSITDTWEP